MSRRRLSLSNDKNEGEIMQSTSEQEMKQKIEQLEKMLAGLMETKSKQEDIREEKSYDIRPDEYIEILSLCQTRLNLSTRPRGGGKIFSFKTFGEKKNILYSNLIEIIETHPTFTEDGLFYILDERVIYKHGLVDVYDKILKKEQIEAILANTNNAVALFKSANKRQKDMIVDMLIVLVRDGADVDMNLVSAISRLSKVNIYDKAEESKEQLKEISEE